MSQLDPETQKEPRDNPTPYEAIFDVYQPLSGQNLSRIGLINAELITKWNRWVHRRVEVLSFSNEDVVRRRMSVDFTIPSWVHDILNPGQQDRAKVLVPLVLLRKGVLANVDLRDESDSAIPLLTTSQNGAVAEASLVGLAESVLNAPVPHEVRCDFRRVCSDPPYVARESRNRLLEEHEEPPESQEARIARAALREVALYRALVESFMDRFLAITVLDLGHHDRRVVSFAYDELVLRNESVPFLRSSVSLAAGNRARRIAIGVSGAGYADSYHIETIAPTGLQISSRVVFTSEHAAEQGRVGSYDRSHLYFQGIRPREEVGVIYRLRPRPSTIVRAAFLVSLLSTVTLVFARLAIHQLTSSADAGATILVAIPGLLAITVARPDDHPMTTDLLLPLRFVAILPGVFAFAAAGVLATQSASWLAEAILWTLISLSIVPLWILGRTWHKCWRQARRRDEPDPVGS